MVTHMSAVRWHINRDGQVRECHADEGECPLGGEHYDDRMSAERAVEKMIGDERPSVLSLASGRIERIGRDIANTDYSLAWMGIVGTGAAVAGLLGGAVWNSMTTPASIDQPATVISAAATPSEYTTRTTIHITGKMPKTSAHANIKHTGYENEVELPDGGTVKFHSEEPLHEGSTDEIVYHVDGDDGHQYLTAVNGSKLERVEIPGDPSKGSQVVNGFKSSITSQKALSLAAVAGAARIAAVAVSDVSTHRKRRYA